MSNVLILRPEAQAAELRQLMQQQANKLSQSLAIECASMLKISAYDDPNHSLISILGQQWDGAMMVSVNAAHYFAQQAREWAPNSPMPRCRWYAVGPVSANAIADVVGRPVNCPWRAHNSDALLELPELQDVAGQRWLLIRGHGGRELFADTMRARGAEVCYLEVYQRQPKTAEAAQFETWQQTIDTIMVSSAEQLGAFLAAAPNSAREWLSQCTWVMASARLKQLLPDALSQRVAVAESAASFAMVEAWQRGIQLTKEV
ncbi:Uroporphyrinogen-III synthase [Pseudidiomarina piscicola]|uniref:Uroporphyrinogen-III synthase n=1 Tax=Pseudidiomarina piscicola TaxID=2614830 RepID=A0A6S6WN82_9GAMM|nr:uroporphyrinogen-III synthase [Pseudidiomarina piscicola]CAB0151528.1 Uroporphyrinogen-III synthase [Pseudidiomarina piscicola]VZT41007.1 Uroporphyrinogen-III synthase [Pseudomonas aeruginosa]